jgi:hypothetical protein
MMSRARAILVLLTLAACGGGSAAVPGSSASKREPGPGDSLAKLHRHLLVDSNPRAIGQAIICEHKRLQRTYGLWEAEVIADRVMDTVFKADDAKERARVERVLANTTFTIECDEPDDGKLSR